VNADTPANFSDISPFHSTSFFKGTKKGAQGPFFYRSPA
jgi:hypothetical protein